MSVNVTGAQSLGDNIRVRSAGNRGSIHHNGPVGELAAGDSVVDASPWRGSSVQVVAGAIVGGLDSNNQVWKLMTVVAKPSIWWRDPFLLLLLLVS